MQAKTSRICEGAGQGPGWANGALIKALSEGDSFDIFSLRRGSTQVAFER
jgi:hypothetical protein